MEDEIWKDVPGYEGMYQVSSLGRLRSFLNKHGEVISTYKILKTRVNMHGYVQKTLVNKTVRKTWDLHRIVAMAFIPNPENKPCIDHINTDRTDNRVENLRWVTYSENALNPITNKKQKERIGPWLGKTGELHPNSKRVYQYSLDGIYLGSYGSIREAKKHTGAENIGFCLCGKRKTAGGFIWSSNPR